jgi:hypothetical protein
MDSITRYLRSVLWAILLAISAGAASGQSNGIRTPLEPLDPVQEVVNTNFPPLYYDPGFTGLRVAPPLEFLRKEKALGEVQATFSVNYLAAGAQQSGRTCEAWDPQAQAAFTFAANIWSSLIQSSIPIVVNACWTALGTGILGSAGPFTFFSNFQNAPMAGTFYPVALANSLAGTDLSVGNPDIVANFSSAFSPNWYFGTDRNTPVGKIDFVSVVLHELGHGLGFLGTMNVNTGTGQGSWGLGNPITPAIYDRFTLPAAFPILPRRSPFRSRRPTASSSRASTPTPPTGTRRFRSTRRPPGAAVPATRTSPRASTARPTPS